MKIGNRDLDKEILIIAEIGNNHEGDFSVARKMIVAAAKAGAHMVKFQTIIPEKLVSPTLEKATAMLTKFQFSYKQFAELKHVADSEGVQFLSTPFDLESVEQLDPLVPAFKIASGDNNFWPLISVVAKKGKPILISTGMADFNAILQTRRFIENIWGGEKTKQDLAILHCVSLYPTPPKDANLYSIPFLKEKLGGTIGYSDHTIGIDAAVLAVALGARVLEKHFTLDKNYSDFPDHQISMDPQDLALLVEKVGQAVEMLGAYGADVAKDEWEIAKVARRSIVAKHNLAAGTQISWNDLDWVRPGGGLAPGNEEKLVGKKLQRDIAKGHLIQVADLA